MALSKHDRHPQGTEVSHNARRRNAYSEELDPDTSDSEPRVDEEIDIVVAQIKRLTRLATLEFSLRVGAVIIHHFYDGDTDAWRSRGPKTTSFRRLARHPELPLSPAALYRCVALFELCERLNAASRWQYLTASHLRTVLSLPTARQENVLAMANAKRWSVRILQEEVLREVAGDQKRGGRRAEPPIARGLKKVTRTLAWYAQMVEQADGIRPSDAEDTRRVIDEARQVLEGLSSSLRELEPGARVR